MRSKIFKKLIAGIATLAIAAQFAVVLPVSAELVRTDVWSQSFDNYTAPQKTEVIADPDDTSNKILKVSSTAGFKLEGFPTTDADNFNLEMDVNFPVALTTGTADKNTNGAYFTFGKSGSTSIKVQGATSGSKVPFGWVFGGGGGQNGKAGDLDMNKWYTVLVKIADAKSSAGTIGFNVYDKAEYAANGTAATPVATKEGMGFRNGSLPDQLNIGLTGKGDTAVDGEYFYLDNFKVFTEEDPTASNELKSISFTTTPGAVIDAPEGDKETKSFPIKLTLTGTKGELTAEECDSITWSHKGTENDDGYIGWAVEDNKNEGAITVTNGVSTYFAVLTATVKKGDNEFTADYKMMIRAAGTSAPANQIYPEAGYPINLNEYADSLVGYMADNGTINDKDPILAKWSSVGSNGARSLTLQKDPDTGDKYIQISNTGGPGAAGNSTTAGLSIAKPDAQIIFEFDTKMVDKSAFVFANTTQNNTYVGAFGVSLDGGVIKAGEGTISGISAGNWYKLLISYDITTQEYYVIAYDMEGTKLGEITGQKGAENASPTVFSIGGGFPTAIKNMRIYKPTAANMEIASAATTVKVPEGAEPNTILDLSATMTTADGLPATGKVDWSFEGGEVAGVTIESTGGQTAKMTVTSSASSGNVVVVASKGGVQAKKTIKLTSSANNVAFKQSVSNVTIPFAGEPDVVSIFEAETRDGQGNPVTTPDSIKYRLLDSTGTKDANIKGVTFKSGVLTVKAGATPSVVYVQAENSEGLTSLVRVNIHGMSFAFGTGEPDEGFTTVTKADIYNESKGYGFASSDGLTDAATNVGGSAAYKFNVKVPNGNYTVKVTTTSAKALSEAVSGSATGTTKSGSEYKIAVCDEVLDLTFDANSTISKLEVSQIAAKNPGEKPAIYSVGDSTTKNSGHYSKYAEDKAAQEKDPTKWVDEREYASWGNCVTAEMYSENFSSYSNHGMAGRNSANYYNQARLETVLLDIAPGDYVTINMGINSESGEPYEKLIEDYYVQGVIQRGAIPVILTHTAVGPVGRGENGDLGSYTYDEATGKYTFNESRETDGRVVFLKGLAEKYNLSVIDVGKWGNDYFNSLTLDDLDKANTANSINQGYKAPTTVLELVQSWSPDHNHYTKELGDKYAAYVMSELANIKNNPFAIESVTQTPAEGKITLTATIKEGASTGSQAFGAYVAQYDANNVLVKIEKTDVTFTNDVLTADVPYTKDEQAAAVKVFVWDSNLKPYVTDTAVFPVTD